MASIVVLGAGRVGKVIARDLSEDENLEVQVADRDAAALDLVAQKIRCKTIHADLSDPNQLGKILDECDLSIGALPGALGHSIIEAVIERGKTTVDISFSAIDPRPLSPRAQETGAVVLYDFGVAPGMSNLLAAYTARRLAPARHISILVGGLPFLRRQPWEYAAPFSPADVLEEYVRPARLRIGGSIAVRPALSGLELVDFPEIGALEAFHTDGLRSLVDTVDCPSMEEKTLRYPGYADKIKLLRDAGFLSLDQTLVDGVLVVPRSLTLKLLEPAWALEDGDDEFTAMRITVLGGSAQPFRRTVWNLLETTDRARGESSMARTTGFPAAIAARKMIEGKLRLPAGVHPPETLAADDALVTDILRELLLRQVHYRVEER